MALLAHAEMQPSREPEHKPSLADDWWIRRNQVTSRPQVPDSLSERIAQNPIMLNDLAQTAASRHMSERGGESSLATALMRLRLKGIAKPATALSRADKEKRVGYRGHEAIAPEPDHVTEIESDEEVTIVEIDELDDDEKMLVVPMSPRGGTMPQTRGAPLQLGGVENTGRRNHLPGPRRANLRKAAHANTASTGDRLATSAPRDQRKASLLARKGVLEPEESASSSGGSIPLMSSLSRAVIIHPTAGLKGIGRHAHSSSHSSLEEEDYFMQSSTALRMGGSRSPDSKPAEESLAHDEYLEFSTDHLRGNSSPKKKRHRRRFLRVPYFLRSLGSSGS